MKVLVPVDASSVALAPIAHLQALGASGMEIEVLLLNVQPRFHHHIAQFTSRPDIPVSVLARGQAGVLERYALPAGVAGLAAYLLSAE